MPLILPGSAPAPDPGYQIDNSCRFNDGDSAELHFSQGTPTDNNTWTFSCWFKRGSTTTEQALFGAWSDGSNQGKCRIMADATLQFIDYQSSSNTGKLTTNKVFRDPSAWMHIVLVWDSDNGTAGNRMRMYINGTEETSFSLDTNPSSGQATILNVSGRVMYVGRDFDGGYWDGYMAEVIFIDGTAYAASDFGEFDSDSPTIWKPKDPSGLTFGNNGCWLDFADSSALGNDVSGNNNDFSVTNLDATDQATDTPTNNFAVLNPLIYMASEGVLSEGNCTFQHHKTGVASLPSTLGMSAGKWYMECKFTVAEGGNERALTGVSYEPVVDAANNHFVGRQSTSWAYKDYDGALVHDTGSDHTGEGYGTGYNVNDIISIALDLDNSKLYFALNGTWQDSGDPTSGATGTGAISITAPASTTTGFYHFVPGNYSAGWYATWACNFGGCPAFALSSAVADGNGYGLFEYAPPSGYLALCTKNLGSDGG